MTERGDAQEVDAHGDQVPGDHRPRGNQEAIVDPQNLEHAHDGGHARVHAGGRAAAEHCEEVGDGGEGGAETREKADDLRTVEVWRKQAGGVTRNEVVTGAEEDRTQNEEAAGRCLSDGHVCADAPAGWQTYYFDEICAALGGNWGYPVSTFE